MKTSKILTKITTKMPVGVTRTIGKAQFFLKKKSPEILLAAGIAGFVGTVVIACRATLKADDVLDEHEENMKNIQQALKIAEGDTSVDYDQETYLMDIRLQKLKTIGNFTKLYAPAIALGAVSLASILASRNIMQKRYLGAIAAYNAVSEAFQTYRKRVVDEYGEKLDRHFRYGTTYGTEIETTVDENGKKVKNKIDTEETTYNVGSDAAVVFDSSNPEWDRNPEFSMSFLKAQQNMANNILHARGHIFLNEVYDMLGFKHTAMGAVVGWVLNGKDSANYIDFGLSDIHAENVRRFVNKNDNWILLDFNHDGVIIDQI